MFQYKVHAIPIPIDIVTVVVMMYFKRFQIWASILW